MLVSISPTGLSNRLWGIVSVLRMADLCNKKAAVLWSINNHCGCLFSDLFKPIDGLKVYHEKIFSPSLFMYKPEQIIGLAWKRHNVLGAFSRYAVDKRDIQEKKYVFLENYGQALILDDDNDVVDFRKYLQRLRLRDELQHKIDTYKYDNKWSDDIIGLHIRQTDAFGFDVTKKAVRYLLDHVGQKVFVASDNWNSIKHLNNSISLTCYLFSKFLTGGVTWLLIRVDILYIKLRGN